MFFDKLFNNSSIPMLEKVVAFTERRHEVLANNIANQNTPFYKAQDLDEKAFQEQLAGAIDQHRRGGSFGGGFDFPSSQSVWVDDAGFLQARVQDEAEPRLLTHDQNNVDGGFEMARLTRNALMHNTATEILRKQYDMLRTAISERVR